MPSESPAVLPVEAADLRAGPERRGTLRATVRHEPVTGTHASGHSATLG